MMESLFLTRIIANEVIGWMPIEKLQEITIYPEFIKREIYHLDDL